MLAISPSPKPYRSHAVPVPNSAHHESNRHFYDRIANAYDLIADSNERAARQAGVHALGLNAGRGGPRTRVRDRQRGR